jgi:N-acyl-phosphatidylethanolamine-hydrolysing phospholipase D
MESDETGRSGPARPSLSRRSLNRRLAMLPLALGGCAGEPVTGAPAAPPHHTPGGFRNPPGSPVREGDFGDWFGFFYRGLTRGAEVPLPAGHVLPEPAVQEGLAARRKTGASLTWLGHATFLIHLAGRTILTDPFLSEHASPVPPLGPRRFAPPGLAASQLPPIDLLLLSHNHYDHLDLPTIEALGRRSGTVAIVPLGLGRYFSERGYERVREVDWGDETSLGPLRIRPLPAIHFSKRTLFDRNQTLWAGYAIEGGGRRIYFAGDTAYGPIFREMAVQEAPFDLALLPIGAYEPRKLMRATHATPEEAVQIGREFRAHRLVAMHWGTIQLTDEPPFEPPLRFRTAAREAGYGEGDAWVMAIGETRAI